jgi:hypothetical protein
MWTDIHVTKHAIEDMEVKLHTSLSLTVDGSEMSSSFSRCFNPGETVLGTHVVWGWADLKSDLHMYMVAKQNAFLFLESREGF